jgi:ferredoxin
MHIDIDKDVCIGAGQCALAAPGVFTQDDDGYSTLLPAALCVDGHSLT